MFAKGCNWGHGLTTIGCKEFGGGGGKGTVLYLDYGGSYMTA